MKGRRFASRWDRAKDSENIVEKNVCENEKGRRQEKYFFFLCEVGKCDIVLGVGL